MATSHTNIKRRRTKSSAKANKARKRIAVAIVIFLAAISAYVVIRSLWLGDSNDSTVVSSSHARSKLMNPKHLKEAYLRANGGLEHIESLQTLRLNGRITTEEREFDLFMLKRRPDMILMTYKFGGGEVTLGGKNGEFWVRQSNPGQPDRVTDLPDEEAHILRRSVDIFGPLLTAYLSGESKIRSIELVEWEEEPALKIKMSDAEFSLKHQLYLDPDNLHILAQISVGRGGEEAQAEFSDYAVVEKVSMPMRTEISNSDGSSSVLVIKSARFNVGASSFIFEK